MQATYQLSTAAVDLLMHLCQPDASLRLGHDPRDIEQIKAHEFFKVTLTDDAVYTSTLACAMVHNG